MTNRGHACVVASLLFSLAIAGCSNDPAAVAKRKLRSAFGPDAKSIEVRVEGSTAILSGTVSERSTQELAEEVARSIPGVTSVNNRIAGPEARGLEKLRVEALDAALEIAVKGALSNGAGTSISSALEVEACDGVVSLRGRVGSSDSRRKALDLAKGVEGVRKVVDLVEVSS